MSVAMIASVTTVVPLAGLDLLTVGVGTRAHLAGLILTNTHTAAVTVAVHNIPSAGSAQTANMICKAISLAAGEMATVLLHSICLTAGVKLHLVPSVDSVVNATLSGGIETI